ncbi:MAG: aminotransferase class V-fold PLP-dependent enzyme [Deltaproteobacteria bacterium]|nr:aminotransferase class V-fold PLP-dependent enzyme [Deltaproteobacteria bacterium]MBT6435169.1 aminotransferase class V-fold PLP-dependent enzyme [Deltaproteobacteria bacterium]MBT6491650.1 aminotransferase class V-fold PLP-dependent enzyme [Deltaproteobacteria bacterium]
MIYLDHNATTRLKPEALEAMSAARVKGRNPMSLHRPGRRARVQLDEAREALRRLCNAPKADVIFTSGGTESDHIALRGLAHARRRAHGATKVILTEVEHPAIKCAAETLAEDGFEVITLDAPSGRIDPKDFESIVDSDVAVVAVMLAHNTTGIVQPVTEICNLANSHGVPVHVDAVQAAGKTTIEFYQLGATSLAVSAHKFGGPRGVGALIIQKCVDLVPIWSGGGQEEGKRSGSHANALIAGMAAAADATIFDQDAMAAKRDVFEAGLIAETGAQILGAEHPRLPNTCAAIIGGIDGRAFVKAMDEKYIAVSAGAACHAASGGMGPAGQIRFSLGQQNTEKELSEALKITVEVVSNLRKER